MKRKITCFERRLEILFLLMQHRKITASIVCKMFQTSRNTIYNDVSFLSRYAPIYTQKGTGGGIFLLDTHRPQLLLYLSLDEEQLLRKLAVGLGQREQRLLEGIANRFSMPKIGA